MKKSILPCGKNPNPLFLTRMYPDKFHIEITKKSPWIVLEQGRIFIMGRSIIENPAKFYDQVHYWIAAYAKDWKGKTRIDLGFEYINTGSTKWLYMLLREMMEVCRNPGETIITWYYEAGDEDMKELGSIIKSLLKGCFSIVMVKNMNEKYYKSILAEPV